MSSDRGDGAPARSGHRRDDSTPAAVAAEAGLTDEEVAERHRARMTEHGRQYEDEAERERRLAIFKDNLLYIEAHNRGGHSYTVGLNQFAGLTNEEFRSGYCGGIRMPEGEEEQEAEGDAPPPPAPPPPHQAVVPPPSPQAVAPSPPHQAVAPPARPDM
ncbi:unnamed protein product [Spirodela intermedia]|uniref:Cathepsin propeptide inhibitor domain-containing protein n=2 Tax=Spirodela intermedia TaxID=51605 RepID=A0A7I8LIS0_SPIIN|nr:unnamed protein product [Spirodela intermedia]CAA6672000.1 unnamed protein product [Spirodela intermedia]CAA7409155.1 unnamed protein product [Spirodela intermedia]